MATRKSAGKSRQAAGRSGAGGRWEKNSSQKTQTRGSSHHDPKRLGLTDYEIEEYNDRNEGQLRKQK